MQRIRVPRRRGIPTGFNQISPGLARLRGYPGWRAEKGINPNGVESNAPIAVPPAVSRGRTFEGFNPCRVDARLGAFPG